MRKKERSRQEQREQNENQLVEPYRSFENGYDCRNCCSDKYNFSTCERMEVVGRMKNLLFWLIIVIFISSVIIAVAIYQKPEGRYQFHLSRPDGGYMWIMDTRTGTIVDLRKSTFRKIKVNGKMIPERANYEQRTFSEQYNGTGDAGRSILKFILCVLDLLFLFIFISWKAILIGDENKLKAIF